MDILILLSLIMLNGLFAMSELAVISSRKERLEALVDEGHERAKRVLDLVENPNTFLSTVQVGITLVGILAGAISGATIAEDIAVLLNLNQTIVTAVVIALTTYLTLVIGELVPKQIALQNPERIAMLVARPMQWLSLIAKPLIFLLSQSSLIIVRILGFYQADDNPSITEGDILGQIRRGIPEGVFDEDEHEMVEAVFRLDNQPAKGIITPRTDIVWIDINTPDDEVKATVSKHPYSGYPICRNTIDNVIGIVRLKDFLRHLSEPETETINLRDIMKKPLFIPENAPTAKILEDIKSSGMHTALIIGEYGGVQGLVTLHDLLEVFVGELDADNPDAVMRDDGSWLLDGLLPIHRVEDIFPNFAIPEEEANDYHSLAGFLLTRLKHIPKTGEYFIWNDYYFEVVDMDNQRIDKVLVKNNSITSNE